MSSTKARVPTWILCLAAAVGLWTLAAPASADVSKQVQHAFRGKILIASSALPIHTDDKGLVGKLKKLNLATITHTSGDDVPTWSFHYVAFLKSRPGVDKLSFDFYTADKQKLYVANKTLMGVNPALTILTGTLSINEDDGLNVGRKYMVKLVGQIKGRDKVFAETTVTTQ